MNVEIVELQDVRVASVRHAGPAGDMLSAWKKLMKWAGTSGMVRVDTRFFGVCRDDLARTPVDRLTYDACLLIPSDIDPGDGIAACEVPGGKYGLALHRGDYIDLGRTWAELYSKWLPGSGYQLRPGPCFEEYLTSMALWTAVYEDWSINGEDDLSFEFSNYANLLDDPDVAHGRESLTALFIPLI